MYAVMCCKAHENHRREVKKSEGISDQLGWDARRLGGSESVCRRSSHKKADRGKVKVRGRDQNTDIQERGTSKLRCLGGYRSRGRRGVVETVTENRRASTTRPTWCRMAQHDAKKEPTVLERV